MQGKGWRYGYGFTAILHGLSILAGWHLVQFVTKPLLIPLLLVFFGTVTNGKPGFRHWITGALFFSWLGDIFLMNEGETYFMAGLGAFLTAHICYIIFFLKIRRKNTVKIAWNYFVYGALAIYVITFYTFLAPHLAAPLKLPVFAYALVIATMFITVYHAFATKNSTAAIYCITGAALFMLSDSLLAINSFVNAFPGAALAVMGTYIFAQLALVLGASQLLTVKLFNS